MQEPTMTDHERRDPKGTLAIFLMALLVIVALIFIYAIAQAA